MLSAVVTLAAAPIYGAPSDKTATYNCLYWGMFMFSLANGLCETAINPLVATFIRGRRRITSTCCTPAGREA